MGYCDGLIKQGIQVDCENPVVMGIEENGIIINRKDIDFAKVVFDEARPNVIKTLVLKSGKKAYPVHVPTKQPFSGTTTTLEEGTNRNSFTNNAGFLVLDNSPEVCDDIIDALATGEFVIIFENKHKSLNKATNPGDSAFQVMGYYQGLRASTLENDKYSEDTEGGWNVVLTETKVPKSALFMYDTSLDATKDAIDSLISGQIAG